MDEQRGAVRVLVGGPARDPREDRDLPTDADVRRPDRGAVLADQPHRPPVVQLGVVSGEGQVGLADRLQDRKSTRLNSSHVKISYAVFCLKKKRQKATKDTAITCSRRM